MSFGVAGAGFHYHERQHALTGTLSCSFGVLLHEVVTGETPRQRTMLRPLRHAYTHQSHMRSNSTLLNNIRLSYMKRGIPAASVYPLQLGSSLAH